MAKAKKKASARTNNSKKVTPTKATLLKKASSKTTKASSQQSEQAAVAHPSVLEYRIFCEDSVRNLEDQVNIYIGKGWAPLGGVVLQNTGTFLQTMVRQS